MVENLSGGTSNLLRMARSGCQSAVAFVALALGDQTFATATYPSDLGDGLPSATDVEDLVRQLWLEPGLARGKALVRTVRLGGHRLGQSQTRLAVAAVPLGAGGGQTSGILGVADPEAKSFGLPELELLSRIAQRLTSYVRARQTVRTQLATAAARREGPAQAVPWWGAEPLVPEAAGGAAGRATRPQSPAPPPFPPPAGTTGAVPEQSSKTRPAAAPAAVPPAVPSSLSGAGPGGAAAARRAPAEAEAPDPLGTLLGGGDLVPGLVPLGALIGRAGRLLGAGTAASGSLAVVVVTIEGMPHQDAGVVADLVRSLRSDLRFDDPLARIGASSFVAVVPLAPGGASSDQVEARLADRAREAVAPHPGAVVRAAHAVAPLSAGRDADELLRSAVVKLRAA